MLLHLDFSMRFLKISAFTLLTEPLCHIIEGMKLFFSTISRNRKLKTLDNYEVNSAQVQESWSYKEGNILSHLQFCLMSSSLILSSSGICLPKGSLAMSHFWKNNFSPASTLLLLSSLHLGVLCLRYLHNFYFFSGTSYIKWKAISSKYNVNRHQYLVHNITFL